MTFTFNLRRAMVINSWPLHTQNPSSNISQFKKYSEN